MSAAPAGATATPKRSRWTVRHVFPGRDSMGVSVGLAIIVGFMLVSVVSKFWTPYPPRAGVTGQFYGRPSWEFPFGTDATGGDVLSRVMTAAATDVGITVAVVGVALVVGTTWGALVGFYGGLADAVTMRVLQTMNAFPSLLLAMLVLATLGRGLLNVLFVVALIPLPDYVRLSRAEIATKKHWEFAEAASMAGRPPIGVLFRHLVPNSMRPMLAFAAINASWVVATVGGLGFLGLGIQPGSAEWGSMIAGGQAGIVSGQWWVALFPGLAILLLAIAFHLVNDTLTDDDLSRRGH